MSRRTRTGLLLAAVCVLSWLTFAWLTVRQCTREGGCYQGRTSTEWSRDLSDSPLQPTPRRLMAVDVLGSYGAPAVPALLKALHDPAPEVRQRAIQALTRVGRAAREVGPALVDVVKQAGDSPQLADSAVEALVSLGPAALPAVPALKAALADPDRAVTVRAADALSRMEAGRPTWPLVLVTLTHILEDAPVPARLRAVEVLARTGASALPAFARAVKNPDSDVRRSVVESLGGLGPGGLPSLAAALEDPDVNVRRWVPRSLAPSGGPAVPVLAHALDDPAVDVRFEAAHALRELGPVALEAVSALRKHALRDPDPVIRAASVTALARIGPIDEGVRSDLKRLANGDPDPMVRHYAEGVLRALGGR